jgi:hypothetical protein
MFSAYIARFAARQYAHCAPINAIIFCVNLLPEIMYTVDRLRESYTRG